MVHPNRTRVIWALLAAAACVWGTTALPAQAADVFVRARVVEPAGERFRLTPSGHSHSGRNNVWYFTADPVEAEGDQWSPWLDIGGQWALHGRMNRAGGIAEWPSMKLTVARLGEGEPIRGCTLEVQLADKPDADAVVITFREKAATDTIGFLLPHPLHEKKDEFETGSQMAARHAAWAKEAMPGEPPVLEKFDVLTSLWGHYDPALARQEIETLKRLGFNVIGSAPQEVLREAEVRTYTATWLLEPDPDKAREQWAKGEGAQIAKALETDQGRWYYDHLAHYVVADEIAVISLEGVEQAKRDGWFREWLRERGVRDGDLPVPIAQVELPAEVTTRRLRTLPRDADLPTRRLYYYAGKFGQEWSVRTLKHTGELIKSSLPAMKTETLPTDHGFFNAWGPPTVGMSYCLLDLFDIGQREAVDILSAEDWLGLNHMYGPNYTWTGAQSFAYLSAIMRSGIQGRNVALRGLITPSDDGYLRLKAYSNIGQGSKSIFFWTYGPTYIGTENYWSDLKSEYFGIAKLTRALARAEDVLYPAQPVSDPVAVLYSVSHDFWHTDDPAAFVETRLTWHALRHLGVQPDFLREEDIEAGRLKDYKALYFSGQCLTRQAAAAIDQWVRDGGVVYLSAGAATRDEFYEPHVPPFAAAVWPQDAASVIVKEQGHRYNERSDLPRIAPMTTARFTLEGMPEPLKVIGYRLNLREGLDARGIVARFEDGKPAAANVAHDRGRVIAAGLLPGLAYSPFKPGQRTLDEVWPAEHRRLFALPLQAAAIHPIAQASEQVVETSLLEGPEGAALVLVNYTYQPISNLRVQLRHVGLRNVGTHGKPFSTEGVEVKVLPSKEGILLLELPLEWTDIVVLPRR